MKVNYLCCAKIAYSLYLPHFREVMKIRVFLPLFVLLSGWSLQAGALFQTFDKAGYYSVMASGTLEDINAELSAVEASSIKEKQAYEGALLMRKAGLLKIPGEKLIAFKTGYRKLESALAKDTANGEYHFLRLIIQEHAPKLVHYDRDEEKDSRDVIRCFPTLSPVLQKAILNYCPHSKRLQEKDLNG